MSKETVRHITNTLGADAICSELGVSAHSIRYARDVGRFSATWYARVKGMCDEVGIPCPMSAFNWRTSAGVTPRPKCGRSGAVAK